MTYVLSLLDVLDELTTAQTAMEVAIRSHEQGFPEATALLVERHRRSIGRARAFVEALMAAEESGGAGGRGEPASSDPPIQCEPEPERESLGLMAQRVSEYRSAAGERRMILSATAGPWNGWEGSFNPDEQLWYAQMEGDPYHVLWLTAPVGAMPEVAHGAKVVGFYRANTACRTLDWTPIVSIADTARHVC